MNFLQNAQENTHTQIVLICYSFYTFSDIIGMSMNTIINKKVKIHQLVTKKFNFKFHFP